MRIPSTLSALTLALTLGLAGCASSGGDDPAATDDPGDTAAETGEDGGDGGDGEAAAGGSLMFVGTDDLQWESQMRSTAPGSTELVLECGEAVNHALAIEGVQGGETLTECEAGGTGSATVELESGEYTFFCSVPGHRDAGMEGTLAVG